MQERGNSEMVWKRYSPSVSDFFSQVGICVWPLFLGKIFLSLWDCRFLQKDTAPEKCYLPFNVNMLEISECTCINMDLLIFFFFFWIQELEVLDSLTRNIHPHPLMEPPTHSFIRIRPSSPDIHDLSKNLIIHFPWKRKIFIS